MYSVIIVCFTILIFTALMLYAYLVLTDRNNDAKKIKVTSKDIANCKARISILEYMEKNNINTLNIDDILTIFPISNNEVKKND